MISSESRMISGLRRRRTPRDPIAKSDALIAMYQTTLGPSIVTLDIDAAGMMPEDHAADGRGEQHDRRHLEGEQVVGEEQAADLRRIAETRADVLCVRESSTGLDADHD